MVQLPHKLCTSCQTPVPFSVAESTVESLMRDAELRGDDTVTAFGCHMLTEACPQCGVAVTVPLLAMLPVARFA
jgi:hypothetical protein